MTWLEAIRGHRLVSSIFYLMDGAGTQNDRLHHFLEKLTGDKASINDLFHRQRLSRGMVIAIIEARVQRRLA